MRRCVAVLCVLCVSVAILAAGCTCMTADQKAWVSDKANRSQAYVDLMRTGETTPALDQAWIESQNESWRLWADKITHGLAAPAFLVPSEAEGLAPKDSSSLDCGSRNTQCELEASIPRSEIRNPQYLQADHGEKESAELQTIAHDGFTDQALRSSAWARSRGHLIPHDTIAPQAVPTDGSASPCVAGFAEQGSGTTMFYGRSNGGNSGCPWVCRSPEDALSGRESIPISYRDRLAG